MSKTKLLFQCCIMVILAIASMASVLGGTVYISGDVANMPTDEAYQTLSIHVHDLGSSRTRSKEVRIRPDGRFRLFVEIPYEQDVWLQYTARHKMLLSPGDSIKLHLDGQWESPAEVYEHIKYTGSAAAKNRQLAGYMAEYEKTKKSFSQKISDMKALTPEAYEQKIKLEYEDLFRHQMAFSAIHELQPQIRQWILLELMADYFADLFEYPAMHLRANSQAIIPEGYYHFLRNIPSFGTAMFENSSFARFVPNGYLHGYVIHHFKDQKSPELSSIISFIENHCTQNQLFKELVYSELLNHYIQLYDIDDYSTYKSKIVDAKIRHPLLRKHILQSYMKEGVYAEAGAAQDIQLQSFYGYSGIDAYNAFLRELAGKTVYIDVWATWCAPCMIEMPNTGILEENVANDRAAFVYVCLDSEEANCLRTIRSMDLGGQHYYFDETQSSFIKQMFNMYSFPHYVLMNPEGTIVDQGEHLTPSRKYALDKIRSVISQSN